MPARRKRLKRILLLAGIILSVAAISTLVVYHFSADLLKTRIEGALGKDVRALRVSLGWNKVIIDELLFSREGKLVGKVGRIDLRSRFLGFLGKKVAISRVTVEDAYFFLETDKQGRLVLPVNPLEVKNGEKRKSPPMPIEIGALSFTNGMVDFRDGTRRGTIPIRLEEIRLLVRNIEIPAVDSPITYELAAVLKGRSEKGLVSASGSTALSTYETRAKASLKEIDLAVLGPYIEKSGDPKITKGSLDLAMDINVRKKKLHSPGTIVLRNLEFAPGKGVGEGFLGVPRSRVLGLLKSENNEIRLDFAVDGDVTNPTFNLRESLTKRITTELAGKLGLPETSRTIKGSFKGQK
jgi:hypothetical protein